MQNHSERTLHFPDSGIEITVDENSFQSGWESVELVDFISSRNYIRAADLGSGDGLLSILLAKKHSIQEIWAFEIQEDACQRAMRNVERNQCQGLIQIRNIDLRKLGKIFQRGVFDLVVMNPPFFKKERDYPSENQSERSAREEIHGDLQAFLQTARFLLNRKGTCYVLFHPSRLDELFLALKSYDFTARELKILYHRDGRALFVMVKAYLDSASGLKIHFPKVLGPSIKLNSQGTIK